MSTAPLFTREFPDFPAADMPAIPAGFEDVSWHNDSCPSFMNEAAGLILFVDFADTAKREYPETTRFNVNVWEDGNTGIEVVASDEWQVVLDAIAARAKLAIVVPAVESNIAETIRLAREFGTLIQGALTVRQFRDVVDLNKTEPADSNVCHSHDFCDANMCMLEAFQNVFGREPGILTGEDDETDTRLWNDAWAIAKAADFFA
jgi:hypothetical protein